ncbi:MAG: DUF423 domain-containing protein [Phycisphaerales bacterium]|jgi:uncharacterized membrane protein YgdD (TMEM256/DUF423 family)
MPNRPDLSRFPLLAAGLLGLTGVGLGAMGAHALKAMLLERGMVQAWDTAAQYHLLHGVALLGAAGWMRNDAAAGGRRLLWAARCWVAGVCLFSGSLYALALGGPRWLGPITPLGGLALMAGWLLCATAAVSREKPA